MELDYDGSDQELEEIEVVDNLKPVDVMHMLKQIRTMAIASADIMFAENYDYIYKKVQEMSIPERIQTTIDKYFK